MIRILGEIPFQSLEASIIEFDIYCSLLLQASCYRRALLRVMLSPWGMAGSRTTRQSYSVFCSLLASNFTAPHNDLQMN